MKVALSFDSLQQSSNQVFGLQVAVSNWVKAYLHYGSADQFSFLIKDAAAEHELYEIAEIAGVTKDRLTLIDARFPRENLESFTNIFRTDSACGPLLWQRETLKGSGYAFTGLSHSIAGLECGMALEQYCLAPSAAGDAIVCPSHAIKSAIQRYWDIYADYLQQRFGTNFKCPVELPIIPLGIESDRFEKTCTPSKRVEVRDKLAIQPDEIVVLWVGRLSSLIKAHPLATYRAVQEAADRTGHKIRLLMQGYFYPTDQESDFRALARDYAPSVKVDFIASDDARFPDGLWAGADIFMSLVDSIQESFGLTPIEAIAAGLPRILSDWDGYKDCVTNGVDGFLVPTQQPPEDSGAILSSLLLDQREIYGGFVGKTGLCVTVDHHAAAEALVQLIQNPEMRATIAAAAKERLPFYDWKKIIPSYEALWQEQAEKRRVILEKTKRIVWPAIPPQVPDPFTMYASFPTAPLALTDRIGLAATVSEIQMLWSYQMNVLALDILPHPNDLMAIIKTLAGSKSMTIKQIFTSHVQIERAALWRALAWFLKLGIVARTDELHD